METYFNGRNLLQGMTGSAGMFIKICKWVIELLLDALKERADQKLNITLPSITKPIIP